MWSFTKYGFFSVVNARKGFGEPGQPVDPDRLMVRSRSQSHFGTAPTAVPTLERPADRDVPRIRLPIQDLCGEAGVEFGDERAG